MAKTNDTIDGLLAEFRGYSSGMPPSYHVTMSWADFRKMLDRFDAAAKRTEWTHKKELETRDAVIQTEVAAREAEREAHRREHEALKKQVGDCAKLREAAEKTRATLEEALQILNGISDEEAGTLNARLEDVADEICEVTQWIIPDALAAPPRNCDVGTAEEQEDRFRRYCNSRGTFCGDCPLYNNRRGECRFAWAQMPYEKGEAK